MTRAMGEVTHAEHVVELGDEDGLLLSTPNDLYLWSQNATIATVQQSDLHVTDIIGEFQAASQSISDSGLLTGSMALQRNNRFGRFTQPFYMVDNYPMEGAVSLPANAPVAVQKPGGTVVWQVGGQNVNVYAEGVSLVSGNTPTHNLIPGEISPSSFTLEADVNTTRQQDGQFHLTLWTADGSPIILGNGNTEITIPAQDNGVTFNGHGEKYVGTSAIQIVSNLDSVARFAIINGTPTIVLHAGEFVKVQFAGLTTLAGALIRINLDGDRNLNVKCVKTHP